MRCKTFIIAELSANHNQSKELALQTIKAAKQSGADAIKLQTYTPSCLTLPSNLNPFIINGTPWHGQNLYELYKQAMTPWEWHEELFGYARSLGLVCFSSPFSQSAIDLLERLDNPIYKVASFEIVDWELILAMAKTKKPMILSKGIATFEEIQKALCICKQAGVQDLTLLQCTSSYPTPLEEANLSLIPRLQKDFGVKVGLSDHTLGENAALCAVSLGACVVEKHFILDRNLGGVDSHFSMQPKEFASMVSKIREIEKLLGNDSYELSPKSKEGRKFMRSLFVVEDVKKDSLIEASHIRALRPGLGVHPKFFKEIIGKRATKDLKQGKPLEFGDWE